VSAASNAPIWQPTAFHATPPRVGVLDRAQRAPSLHRGGGEAGGVLPDHEGLHGTVVLVLREDEDQVGDGAVADPALGAVEHPFLTVPAHRRLQAQGDVGAAVRLGQGEAADLAQRQHVRQPPALLLLRAEKDEGPHRQAVVHAEEGRHRRVDAGGFEGDEAREQPGGAR
jgi:hypothetical protein